MYGPRVLFRLDPFLTLSGDFQGPCTRGVYYSDLTTLPRSSEIQPIKPVLFRSRADLYRVDKRRDDHIDIREVRSVRRPEGSAERGRCLPNDRARTIVL